MANTGSRHLRIAIICTCDHNAHPSQTDGYGRTNRQADRGTDRRTEEHHGNSATIRSMYASRAKIRQLLGRPKYVKSNRRRP